MDHSLIWRSARFREEKRMAIQTRHFGTRLLLILALVAALLAGIVAVQWMIGQSGVAHAIVTSSHPQYLAPVGNGDGGGRYRAVDPGNDYGGGH
jgi:hypothetical protein